MKYLLSRFPWPSVPDLRWRVVVCGLLLAAPLTGSAAAGTLPHPVAPVFHLFPSREQSPDPETDLGPGAESQIEHRLRQALHEDAADLKSTAHVLLRRPWQDLKRRPLLGAVLVGALVYTSAHKEQIRYEAKEDRVLANDHGLLTAGSHFGEWQYPAAALLAIYFGGLTSHRPGLRESSRLVLESMLFTGAVTVMGQSIFAEERPKRGGDLHFFSGIGHGVSGHAAASVALTLPLVRRYLAVVPGEGRWKRVGKRFGQVIGYGIPVLTGLSRIRDDQHYLWNVLAGWGIGYYVSDTVWKAHVRGPYGEREQARRWMPRAVSPYVNPQGGSGVALSWSF